MKFEELINLKVDKSDIFESKAKYLLDTYKCFIDQDSKSINSKWSVNKGREFRYNINREKVENKKPPRIGNKDLSIEAISRKDFLSIMNKLTLQNKNVIIKNLRSNIRIEQYGLYIEIMWDMMQRAPEFIPIYFEILKVIEELVLDKKCINEKWEDIWNTYYIKRAWIPSEELLQENDYDEFCDFVKWKKRTIATIHIWLLLWQKKVLKSNIEQLIFEISNDCDKYLTETLGASKVSDLLLEYILVIVDKTATEMDDNFIELLKKWLPRINELKASCKFKLYDINDILDRKMKSIFRVKKKNNGGL